MTFENHHNSVKDKNSNIEKNSSEFELEKKRDLRKFNPEKTGTLEAEAWQAYYNHKFFKLSLVLVKSLRALYLFGPVESLQAGYYVADATIDFRKNKGQENKERVKQKLEKFFKVLSDHSLRSFDYRKAAELEVQWWFVDRYPTQHEISREEAIANAAASIYNIDPSLLNEYANYRAQAMILQDEAEAEHKEADWYQIELLLKKCYHSLFEALNKDNENNGQLQLNQEF